MRSNPPSRLPVSVLALVALGALAPAPVAQTAPYSTLTNDRVEFTNFHPEPFAGIANDRGDRILAVNPYNNTWLRFPGPLATTPELRVLTGHNPVSIGVWNPGPTPEARRILVVCTGSHALFLHHPADGRILNVLQLDSEPADLEIDEENDRAYVSCRGDNTVVAVDLLQWSVVEHYPIPCGQRPGPLHLDRGDPGVVGDETLWVASMVTGNNSIFSGSSTQPLGLVLDLDTVPWGELPDEDVFRIDPTLSGASAVQPALRRAGSLIFELARNPSTGDMWILSTDSNNKDLTLDTEPLVKGKIVINQLLRVPGLNATSTLFSAADGQDLDDIDPSAAVVYDASRSVNQARTVAFRSNGEAFVASPMSDVIAKLGPDGSRLADLHLPPRAQCYALRLWNQNKLLALCLGTMTVEVFDGTTRVASLPLGNDPTPGQVRRGRDIVLDGQISQDGRSTCFSCHEGGRSDQLGWSIANEPIDHKDVMVTQSLLSIEDTFPHHWRGERDLPDFRGAFVGLLGAPEALAPTVEEMRDVIAFLHSLKAPANPLQNFRRILDDSIHPSSQVGFTASAVLGQQHFESIENFNDNTCAECHSGVTGSNGNQFAEVGSILSRANNVEVAHLRQLQHKGLDTLTLVNGTQSFEVNENGFGALHNGSAASVFTFIFETGGFVALTPQERREVFEFVEQFDQGIAPGCHWATWYRQGSPAQVEEDIDEILLHGAEMDWLDVVAFGRFHDGTVLREARWLYMPGTGVFHSDDPAFADQTWAQFMTATQAGLAENAFLGVPRGNGFRIAFDPDADDLETAQELIRGTDPWKADTDGDQWPDGYEVFLGEDPLVSQATVEDELPPAVVGTVERDFVSARAAKWHVEFDEDATYVVDYQLMGGETGSYHRDYFVRDDTFVLTFSSSSNPAGTGPSSVKPAPDGTTVFSATITMTDRNGNQSLPVPLMDFTPLATQAQKFVELADFVHVDHMTATIDSQDSSSLTATVTIDTRLDRLDPSTNQAMPLEGRVVVCTVAVQNPVTGQFEPSTDFSSIPAFVTDYDLADVVKNPDGTETLVLGSFTEGSNFPGLNAGPDGDYILSDPTGPDGTTQITFTQLDLMQSGQQVKLAVQAILTPILDGSGMFTGYYWTRSHFLARDRRTEMDVPDLIGPDYEGVTEVCLPFQQ